MEEAVTTTTWRTDTDYKVGDEVFLYSETYRCYVSHKSNIFGKDLFDYGYWYHPKRGPHQSDLVSKNKRGEL